MAIAPDGEANLSGRAASSTTWSLGNKTTAGSDRCGTVRLFVDSAGSTTTPTWGGAGMTHVGTVNFSGASKSVRTYEIVNPPTGSSAVSVAVSPASEGAYLVSSYSGVDQADRIGDMQTASGNGVTATVNVTSAAGELVLDAMDMLQVINSVGAGQTSEFTDTAGATDRFGCSREAGAGTVTMSWSTDGTLADWGIVAFSLREATGGGATDIPVPLGTNTITGRAPSLGRHSTGGLTIRRS
jgi:hypothetical protein